MKITPGGSGNTKMYFENLFIKEGCKNVIGYTKDEGDIEKFSSRWHKMKVGDLIVVIEGFNRVFGVVEVTSEAFDDEKEERDDKADWFYHRRRAELVKYFNPSFEAKANTNRDTIIEYSGDGAIEICNEVWDKIKEEYFNQKKRKQMKQKIDILKYKKQIILQGPPGTGKTREAKIIAEEITLENIAIEKIDKIFIQENIKVGLKLSTPDKIDKEKDLVVDSIIGETINLKISTGSNYTVSFDQVLKCITEPNDPNPRTYAKGIIHFLKTELAKKQYSIIQFHPAYSYEDFVRGITAKSNEGSIEYKTENKLLAEFASLSKKNYLNSLKKPKEIAIQNWIENKFYEYISNIQEKLEKDNGKTYLFNSKAFVKRLNEDSMRCYHEEYYPGSDNGFDIRFDVILEFALKTINITDAKDFSYDSRVYRKMFVPLLNDFKSFCGTVPEFNDSTEIEPLRNFVIIIDEINRANLPSVLGELIYALEYRFDENNPRETEVESMYDIDGNRKLTLPPNLYIIGTMNTADRSVGHIDYAIRRRFAFIDVLPKPDPIKMFALEKFKAVSGLFIKNYDSIDWSSPVLERSEHLAHDFRPEDVWIGHSYFITKDYENDVNDEKGKAELELKMKYEVIPILKEYLKDGILVSVVKDGVDKTMETIMYLNKA